MDIYKAISVTDFLSLFCVHSTSEMMYEVLDESLRRAEMNHNITYGLSDNKSYHKLSQPFKHINAPTSAVCSNYDFSPPQQYYMSV